MDEIHALTRAGGTPKWMSSWQSGKCGKVLKAFMISSVKPPNAGENVHGWSLQVQAASHISACGSFVPAEIQ